MKKRNLFFAGVVLLLIVLVGLLPVILSSGRVQDFLVSRVNSDIPGALSVGKCSIGWQQGLQCNRLVYDDATHGIHVTILKVSSSQGLLALIVAPMNLGTVSVDEPVLVLPGSPPAVEQSPVIAKNNTPPVSSPAATEKLSPAKESVPFWDRMIVKLLVNEAVVKLASGKAPAEILVRNGSLDASLASGTVHFELDLESADGEGTATADGFINLPTRKGALLDTLVTEINLQVMDVQVEPFLALLPDREIFPKATAELSSELLIKATGIHTIQVSGTSMLRNVALAGGFLGEDQPRFKQVALDLEVKRDGVSWQSPTMLLSSDVGTLALAGSYEGQNFLVTGKGRLELPILFDQFPHLFKVKPDTSLQNGGLDFTVSLEKDQQQLDVTTDMVVEKLAGMQNRQPFAWNSPITLHLDGSITDREPQVGKFSLKAPFLNLVGRGDLKAFSLHGSADLGQAVQELGRIFQLSWAADGRLRLSAESKEDGDNRYVVNASMEIADFTLSRQGKAVVPRHQLVFSGRLKTPGKFPNTRAEAMDLVFDLSSWPGRMNGKLDSLYRKDGHVSARYRLQSDLQLGRLSDLLHNFEILQPETTLTGTMDLEASGYTEENRLVVREFDNRIHDFILYRQGKIFKDSSVHLFTMNSVADADPAKAVRPLELADNSTTFFARGGNWNVLDIANHRIVLRNLGLTSDLGSLHAHRISIDDWQQIPDTLSVKVDGKADLGRLTSVLQQYDVLVPEQTLDGNGSFAVDLAAGKAGKEHAGTVQLDIDHATVSMAERIVLNDETLSFNASMQGSLANRDIDFETFDLHSGLLSLQAKGRLQYSGKEPNFSLSGELTLDFSSLFSLLNRLYATDIRAAGKQKEQFSLYYPLVQSADEKYRKLQFATTLQAGYTALFGIDLQQPVMQLSMEKGVLQAPLTAGLNSGVLKLSPRIDYTLSPPVATLPEAEQVLTDVQLGQPLVDLLQRINPVLGLLARPTGNISARMDRFSWPLVANGAQQADFSVVFDVSKITLVPDGVLHEILVMAGLGDKPLTLDQSEITCTAARARISCTPLEMMVAESEMTLAGSVGFDGSLDYLLEVPVTKKLVGKEGYRILQGTTLKVPIRGSRDQAIFDSDALTGAVSDLLGQAAGKAAGKVIEQQVDKILPGLLDGLLGN